MLKIISQFFNAIAPEINLAGQQSCSDCSGMHITKKWSYDTKMSESFFCSKKQKVWRTSIHCFPKLYHFFMLCDLIPMHLFHDSIDSVLSNLESNFRSDCVELALEGSGFLFCSLKTCMWCKSGTLNCLQVPSTTSCGSFNATLQWIRI